MIAEVITGIHQVGSGRGLIVTWSILDQIEDNKNDIGLVLPDLNLGGHG